MEIDKKKCVGCGNCHAVCTMGAIYLEEDGKSVVHQDECVECNTCYRVLQVEYGKLRRLSPQKAAHIMATCCECGAFNPVRAEQLLEKMVRG